MARLRADKATRAAIRASWFNRHRLKLNKWAESLSIEMQRTIFPDTPDEELPYIWNRISQQKREQIYKMYQKETKDTSVQSNASNYYDPIIITKSNG